jgi:hypothetical protein
VEKMDHIYLKAEIQLHEETDELKEAASVIELPKEGEKQIDLQYFSAVFVSSGANLNHAYFLPSELVKAEGTIVNKAMDVEHNEEEIVGHIYKRIFMDEGGKEISLEELASIEEASLDKKEVHIAIAGIIYKNRFPDLAEEVVSGKWCVSMEAYFKNFDVKVGDLIITRKEAEVLGIADDVSIFGRIGKVFKAKKEIAVGKIDRVLRGITFSGCGFVKKPANPTSVVLETATDKGVNMNNKDDILIIDYDKISNEEENNNVTSNVTDTSDLEEAELQYNDTIGICVSYKKEIYGNTFKDGRSKILHTDWCTLYERGCTSFSRDTTDPKCLRNQVQKTAASITEEFFKERAKKDKRKELLEDLQKLL